MSCTPSDLDERSKTAIMHNKFLIKGKGGQPTDVLTGSANFTPEGLTSQANVLHTFRSGRALEDRHHAQQVPDQGQGWSAHRRADGLRELHAGRAHEPGECPAHLPIWTSARRPPSCTTSS